MESCLGCTDCLRAACVLQSHASPQLSMQCLPARFRMKRGRTCCPAPQHQLAAAPAPAQCPLTQQKTLKTLTMSLCLAQRLPAHTGHIPLAMTPQILPTQANRPLPPARMIPGASTPALMTKRQRQPQNTQPLLRRLMQVRADAFFLCPLCPSNGHVVSSLTDVCLHAADRSPVFAAQTAPTSRKGGHSQ